MNARRLGLALVVALVLSVGVTSLFYASVRRQQAASRPKVVQIVAAATDLQPGTTLSAQHLSVVDWPADVAVEGVVRKAEEIIGRVLMYPVGRSEPIRQRDLATPGSGIGLTAKIPDGMRAAAVRTNEVNNIAGFVFPGCRVDVLATLNVGGTPLSKTVLQNVQVLSVGQKTEPDPTGKPENVSIVTLLLTPEDSEKLALAGNQGSIQFVLRNGGDATAATPGGVDLPSLVGAPKRAPEAAPRMVRTAKPPTVYTVETLAGDRKSIATFQSARTD
ncbi:MAG TPA: Flp pilus assembly protein CpaB [Terriglobales bacterium]|nr:Flp pilus assembly protein CpaB [Terriglobales bacterium]